MKRSVWIDLSPSFVSLVLYLGHHHDLSVWRTILRYKIQAAIGLIQRQTPFVRVYLIFYISSYKACLLMISGIVRIFPIFTARLHRERYVWLSYKPWQISLSLLGDGKLNAPSRQHHREQNKRFSSQFSQSKQVFPRCLTQLWEHSCCACLPITTIWTDSIYVCMFCLRLCCFALDSRISQ